MEPDISGRVAQLRSFSRQQLLDLWEDLYKKPVAPGLRREVMIPFLAYRIQELAYGGLKTTTRNELRRLARALKEKSSNGLLSQGRRLKSGTRLSRQWHGETHEVLVTEAGFEHRGVRYRSLSEIARKVTGTRWSGPSFFGIHKVSQSVAGRKDG